MKKKMLFVIVPLLIIFILIVAILPPSLGKMPNDHRLSEKTYIETDGVKLGMELLSDNTDNPVLLVCGGGPGIPQYLVESLYPSVLPKYFTVCYFDYRKTGLSFDSDIDSQSITTDLMIDDVLAVTDYLKDRFGKDKIYIMGHSFGSYVALNTVYRHPENYIAYLAMSQVCDQTRSEIMAYDYMRAQYESRADMKMVRKFDEYKIKESSEEFQRYCSSSLRDTAMHELGVGTTREMDNVITDLFFPSLRVSAYTPMERINLWRGKAGSKEFPVNIETDSFNAFEDIKRIEVPIYFFAGEYDMTCCTRIQQEYYEVIDAPSKEFFLYKDCAHSPIYEDPDKTCEILEKIISEA